MKNCLECDNVFSSPSKKSKFCSLSCANKYNGKKFRKYVEINCQQCNSVIRGRAKFMRNRKFCDSSCSAKFNNTWIHKKLPEGQCDNCGKLCKKSRKYCSSNCQIKAKSKRYCERNKVKRSKHVRDYRSRQKQLAVNYKGGSCQHCGYTRCLKALQFHHLDPNEKDFTIGKWLGLQKSFEQIKSELDKCILLCANCHVEEHERILSDQ